MITQGGKGARATPIMPLTPKLCGLIGPPVPVLYITKLKFWELKIDQASRAESELDSSI